MLEFKIFQSHIQCICFNVHLCNKFAIEWMDWMLQRRPAVHWWASFYKMNETISINQRLCCMWSEKASKLSWFGIENGINFTLDYRRKKSADTITKMIRKKNGYRRKTEKFWRKSTVHKFYLCVCERAAALLHTCLYQLATLAIFLLNSIEFNVLSLRALLKFL